MTKSLIEQDGTYVQSFGDDTVVPPALLTAGRSVVASAPDSALQKWNGVNWGADPLPPTAQQVAQALLADQSPNAVVLRGLIQLLATRFGITPAAVVTAIVNAAN